jgi:hypothetical protein
MKIRPVYTLTLKSIAKGTVSGYVPDPKQAVGPNGSLTLTFGCPSCKERFTITFPEAEVQGMTGGRTKVVRCRNPDCGAKLFRASAELVGVSDRPVFSVEQQHVGKKNQPATAKVQPGQSIKFTTECPQCKATVQGRFPPDMLPGSHEAPQVCPSGHQFKVTITVAPG